MIDSELIKHLPASFQIWQRIELEAQKRADEKIQKILSKNKSKYPAGKPGTKTNREFVNATLPPEKK